MVEDSEDDVLLTIRALKKDSYDPVYERVEDAVAMRKALRERTWDVILCDYQMPQFNGLAAIALLKKTHIDIPLIIVSGAIGEEMAAECMRSGAHDYVMKGNLSRLAPAIERELKEAESRIKKKQVEKALQESEEKYRLIAKNMADVISVRDMNLHLTYVSPSIMRIRGFTVEEVVGQTLDQIMTPESLQIALVAFEEEMNLEASGTADPNRIRVMELEEYKKDGSLVWLEVDLSYLRDKDCKPIAMLAVSRDITARKRADDELKKSKKLIESVLNSSQDLILVVDRDLKVLMSNWKSPLYTGHTEFPISSHCYEAFIHRDTPCESCHALGVFSNGKPILTEYYNQYTKLFMEVNAYPIFDDDNHVILVAENVRDITERKQAAERIRKALRATTQAIAVTVETRDPYTAGHQRRTADLARSIATEMNLSVDQIDGIRMAATIHDLGKISVPAEILSKPKKLTDIEFSLIKTHAQSGHDILKDIDFSWPVARTVLEHHERMDGSGYPNGLTGDNILLESRILAVADVVESMGSHRPYRPAQGIDAALKEIEKNRGTLYDNTVVDACLRLFREKGYQLKGT
jgi:PAS domain S-box-containing protein